MQDYILYCFHSIIPRQQNLTLFSEKKKEREREPDKTTTVYNHG